MKLLSLLSIIVLFGCKQYQDKNVHTLKNTNTNSTGWQTIWVMDGDDTVSGYAMRINGRDTIIQDFGINPSWTGHRKPKHK